MRYLLLFTLLLACSDPVDGSDAAVDTLPDTVGDAASDSTPDLGMDTDVIPVDETKAQRVCDSLDAFLAETGLPGGSIGVRFANGGTKVCVSGVADTTDSRLITPSDRFRVGSVTKTFVTASILLLAEEGTLSLEDTLDMYFSGFENNPTLVQMMNHTSGLGEYAFDQRLRGDGSQPVSEETLIEIARSQPTEFPLGNRFKYSNTNYMLLGAIIGKVTGESWHKTIRNKLLTPLSLEQTFVDGFEDVPGGHIRGYERQETGLVDVRNTFHPTISTSAGCMISNADNLLRWGHALYDDLLGPESLNLMTQGGRVPHVDDNGEPYDGNFVSLANFIETDDEFGDVYGHSGGLPGFAANMRYLKDSNLLQVILINGTTTSQEMNTLTSKVWGDLLLP